MTVADKYLSRLYAHEASEKAPPMTAEEVAGIAREIGVAPDDLGSQLVWNFETNDVCMTIAGYVLSFSDARMADRTLDHLLSRGFPVENVEIKPLSFNTLCTSLEEAVPEYDPASMIALDPDVDTLMAILKLDELTAGEVKEDDDNLSSILRDLDDRFNLLEAARRDAARLANEAPHLSPEAISDSAARVERLWRYGQLLTGAFIAAAVDYSKSLPGERIRAKTAERN